MQTQIPRLMMCFRFRQKQRLSPMYLTYPPWRRLHSDRLAELFTQFHVLLRQAVRDDVQLKALYRKSALLSSLFFS